MFARFAAVVVALLIAFSRLELGVHYFTDVIAGALIGYVVVEGMSAVQSYKSK
jgi:membrane-associated phospholipid phosphatase